MKILVTGGTGFVGWNIVEAAVEAVLDAGLRTGDIMSDGKTQVSTTQMGEAVVAELDKRAA